MKNLLLICLLLAALWPTTQVYGQLVEIERIPIDAKEGTVMIAPNGKVINFSKGVARQTGARISGGKISLAEGEQPVLLTSDFLYSKYWVEGNNSQVIIKYKTKGNSLTELTRMSYPAYKAGVTFFENGSLFGQVLDNARIDFFSNNLKSIGSYIPFVNGYEIDFSSVYKNSLLMGIPNNINQGYKLVLLSSAGKIIFDKQIEDSGRLISVLASENHFATSVFYISSKSYKIYVFDKQGNKLWDTEIKERFSNNWRFSVGTNPFLVTASYRFGLKIFDATSGSSLQEISWKDIFAEASVTGKNEMNYTSVVGVKAIENNKMVVMISQATGRLYENNLLFIVDILDKNRHEIINTGISKSMPKLYQKGKSILVINESEIINYDTNE